jgi:hypothetical protein
MDAHGRRTLAKAGLGAAPPLLLAVLECFHPHPQDLLTLGTDRWLFVHYAQIPLFPLVALSIAALLSGCGDITARVSRVALFVFAVSFVAFDTAAGVVTGILAQAAQASSDPAAWRAAIETVWWHPVIGQVRHGHIPSLAAIGAASLSIGTVAAALSLHRAGRAAVPLVLLALSGFGLQVFNTHAWPGGPLTFGGIALAVAWLQWRGERSTARASDPPVDPLGIMQRRAPVERRRYWRPAAEPPKEGRPLSTWRTDPD